MNFFLVGRIAVESSRLGLWGRGVCCLQSSVTTSVERPYLSVSCEKEIVNDEINFPYLYHVLKRNCRGNPTLNPVALEAPKRLRPHINGIKFIPFAHNAWFSSSSDPCNDAKSPLGPKSLHKDWMLILT